MSINSLTYNNGYIYATRDAGYHHLSNLYRISDVNLIGGYLVWLDGIVKQCALCRGEEIYLDFDVDNWIQGCANNYMTWLVTE